MLHHILKHSQKYTKNTLNNHKMHANKYTKNSPKNKLNTLNI